MNEEAQIWSEILDSYLLGVSSRDENEKLEEVLQGSKALRRELRTLSLALEKYLFAFAHNPPLRLRANILNKISELNEENTDFQ